MSSLKRGLGRGLDALLATSAMAQSRVEEEEKQHQQPKVTEQSPLRDLPLSQLVPGAYQPRKEMQSEALQELAESIRTQGIIQPIVVRQLSDDNYEIIAGERRFRAAQLVGLTQVPCLIRVLDNKAAGAIALIENIQRENLNVMEEAQALAKLIDDFSLTHHEVAKSLGKSRATISNLLRLNALASSVKEMLFSRQLEMGHARALLALSEEQQVKAAQIAVDKKYTVRQTEALVKKMLAPVKPFAHPADPFISVQDRLSDKLGADVILSQKANGKGKLVINFAEKEKLEQILAIFGESL